MAAVSMQALRNSGIFISFLLGWASLPVVRCGLGRADRYMQFEPEAKFYSGDSYSRLFGHNATLTGDRAPHVTLLDPDGVMANLSQFTVEGFVRIRDPRILAPPSFNRSVECSAFYRLPVMGTLQHRKPPNPNSISQAGGFQLSCGWSGSAPECCMEIYTAPSDLCPTAACVPVPHYTSAGSEWFHLTGTVSGSRDAVAVVLTDLFGVSTAATTPLAGRKMSAIPQFPFRIGAQLPFTREGTLMGSSQTDADGFSYRFFRGDVDEIRVWPTSRDPVDLDPPLFAFESVAPSTVCSIAVPESMLLSMNVREDSELQLFTGFGIVAPDAVTQRPVYQAASGFTSLYDGFRAYALAYRVTFEDPVPPGACQDELQDYYAPTCATYFDRPALMRTRPEGTDQARGSLTSSHVVVDRWRGVDYWWVPEASAPGSVLHMVVADLNRQDTVDLLGFGAVCSGGDVAAGRCEEDESQLVGAVGGSESWVRFNYTLYDEPEAEGNIPLAMFQHGLLWRPHARYRSGGDSSADRLYRTAGNPMARQIGDEGYVTKLERAGADCAATSCDALQIAFPDPFPADPAARANFYHAYECHPSLRGAFRLLCLEWLVPPQRGWNISVEFVSDLLCPQALGAINDVYGEITPKTTYYAAIGYEASPEWLSPSEFPKFSAVPYSPVVVDPSSECPDCRPSGLGLFVLDGVEEGAVIQVKVGEVRPMEFYARDRNLDDAVDILPREDPGLPNGASLRPALPAPAETAQNWQCDPTFPCPRPHIFRRVLFFEPVRTQVNNTYKVCFYTSSYSRDGDYAYPYGSRQSVPRELAPPDWPSVWVDRCIQLRVQPPLAAFTLCDGAPCASLERGERQFTAGSSDCSTELEFTVADLNPLGAGEEQYTIMISKDPQFPGPPGLALDLVEGGRLQQTYKVVWTPQVGVDDNRDGYRTCLIAHDEFFMSTQRLCFTAVVRKCKYCMAEGETLEVVGRRFGVDWLQIYLANPHIKDPDNILPSERLVNLGVIYTVRAGDYLDLLAQRFFQSSEGLRRINTDVGEDGGIRAGMEMCVMPPVCSVDCLYGTDCHVY